jgi:hypothetical protein
MGAGASCLTPQQFAVEEEGISAPCRAGCVVVTLSALVTKAKSPKKKEKKRQRERTY